MTEILSRDDIERVVARMAAEVIEATSAGEVGLVGIRRGGVPLAGELARAMKKSGGTDVPVGTIDITLYRDDAATALPDPKIGPSDIPFSVQGRDVVLVDDVLQTGRTVRAAIDALLDYGRPRRVWLCVLIDRGGRELPLAADFVGRTLTIDGSERVDVELGADEHPERVVRRPCDVGGGTA